MGGGNARPSYGLDEADSSKSADGSDSNPAPSSVNSQQLQTNLNTITAAFQKHETLSIAQLANLLNIKVDASTRQLLENLNMQLLLAAAAKQAQKVQMASHQSRQQQGQAPVAPPQLPPGAATQQPLVQKQQRPPSPPHPPPASSSAKPQVMVDAVGREQQQQQQPVGVDEGKGGGGREGGRAPRPPVQPLPSPPQPSRRPPPPPPLESPTRAKWRGGKPPSPGPPLLMPPLPQHPLPPVSDIRDTSPTAFDRGGTSGGPPLLLDSGDNRAPPLLLPRRPSETSVLRGRPPSPPAPGPPPLGRGVVAPDSAYHRGGAPTPDDTSPPFEPQVPSSALGASCGQQQSYTTSGVKAALAQLLEAQGFRVKKPSSLSGIRATTPSPSPLHHQQQQQQGFEPPHLLPGGGGGGDSRFGGEARGFEPEYGRPYRSGPDARGSRDYYGSPSMGESRAALLSSSPPGPSRRLSLLHTPPGHGVLEVSPPDVYAPRREVAPFVGGPRGASHYIGRGGRRPLL